MATECCDDVIGGEYFVKMGGARYEGMGALTIRPAGRERTAAATAHGEIVITEEAIPVTARLDFANKCNADPKDLWEQRCSFDVTFVEASRDLAHMFSKAYAVGTPEIDVTTGLVSGIEFAVARKNYLRKNRS